MARTATSSLAIRLSLLQFLVAVALLALSFRWMPLDWQVAIRSLPTVALRDVADGLRGAAPGALFEAAWRQVAHDPVSLPWLVVCCALSAVCALLAQLFASGPAPARAYAIATAVAVAAPALLWWLPLGPPVVAVPIKLLGTLVLQTLAWLVLVSAKPGGVLRDVDENEAWLAALKRPYDARRYLGGAGVFLGLVPRGEWRLRGRQPLEPLVVPVDVLHGNHAKLVGASGVGKSKLAGLLLTQLHTHGDAVVVFDPKEDKFLPRVIAAATRDTGRPFVYINLRHRVPQINPFHGCDAEEVSLLLQAGLGLDKSANPAVDFYRGGDRQGAGALARGGAADMLSLVRLAASMPEIRAHENFWRELQELARVVAFHTEGDRVDLAATIAAGGVIYVVGDTDDLRVVAAQKLLLARITQIIKARPRDGSRQVALMLDEYKYLISNAALRALGTLRDRNCNLLLAFQSFGDLKDCPGFAPEAVRGAADNCSLSFVYKLDDRATAEDFARMAGDNRVMVQTADKVRSERGSLREANRELVTLDMLTTNAPKPLPGTAEASVCWLFGIGRPLPLSTSHLPAGDPPAAIEQPSSGDIDDVLAQANQSEIGGATSSRRRGNRRREVVSLAAMSATPEIDDPFLPESEDPAQ